MADVDESIAQVYVYEISPGTRDMNSNWEYLDLGLEHFRYRGMPPRIVKPAEYFSVSLDSH